MSRSILPTFGVLALLGIGIACFASSGEQPKAAPRSEAFSKQPLLVFAKEHVAATLEQAEVRELGGRHFVVGKEVKGSPYTKEAFSGARVWIPLDSVTQLVELPDFKGK